MIGKLFVILLFITSLNAGSNFTYINILGKDIRIHTPEYYIKQFKHLSKEQKAIAKKTYVKAIPFNLQNTMTAIAFMESSFGLYMSNTRDGTIGSFGVFHNLVDSVYSRYVIFKPLNKNKEIVLKLKIGQRLIEDYDFSFTQALAELKYWQNYAISKNETNVWRSMVIRYNGGSLGLSKRSSIKYYYELVNIIKALKQSNIK